MRAVLVLLAAAALLAGCAFDNLLLTSLNGDRAFVRVAYRDIGFTVELRESDARQLQQMRDREAAVRRATSQPTD